VIFDSLHIAATSLRAQQKSMDVVSNNIANANTPGYTRQRAELAEVGTQKLGGVNFGRGVDLAGIGRIADPLIDRALANNQSQSSFWDTLATGLGSIENLFGSLNSPGLSASLDAFFGSWQQLANNPQDMAQRLNVRSKGSDIATQLASMSQQLIDLQKSSDAQIDQKLGEANTIIDRVAKLSISIRHAQSTPNRQANDLLDQRDELVRQLGQTIPIQRIDSPDGSMLLQSSSGSLLVQDDLVAHLQRGAALGNGFAAIVTDRAPNDPVQGLENGGSVGGLLALRDARIGDYRTQLDSLAANLVFAVNREHAQGSGSSPLKALAAGQPVANPALAINSPLQNAPFASKVVSGGFTVHTYDAAGAATPPGGTQIAITAGSSSMNSIVAALNGVPGLAASLDAQGKLNLAASGGGSFALGADSSNFLAAYEINTFFHGRSAASITLDAGIAQDAGRIATGTVDPFTSQRAVGDNRTALAILAVQNSKLSFDGSATNSLHDRSLNLSGSYGTDMANARQQQLYRSAEASSLTSQRDAISGVNVDEELVAMIKFQRAYEAASKIIATNNTMLDSLLGLIK